MTGRAELLRDQVTPDDRRAAYESQGLWDDTTLAGRVAVHAAERPDDTAIVVGDGRWSYGQLFQDAAACASSLKDRGVSAGSVVSIQLPNCYEFAVSAVAVQSLGAVINPLLPNYRLRELSNVFTVAEPAAIITPGEYRGFDHRKLVPEVEASSGVSVRQIVVSDQPGSGAEAFSTLLEPNSDVLGSGDPRVISELIFTSGTEARPKAIMHTEQTANFSVRVARSDLGVTEEDIVWMPSPLGHSTGFNYGLRFALYHGLPIVLQDRWDGDHAAQLVTKEGCSYTMAATTFLRELTESADRLGVSLRSLKYFGCGGATVPPALVEHAQAAGIGVLRLYGSTEVLVGSWNRPDSTPAQKQMTDGLAMSHVDMEVRDEEGRRVERGTPGELYVRGPDTCVGFFADPERTAASIQLRRMGAQWRHGHDGR